MVSITHIRGSGAPQPIAAPPEPEPIATTVQIQPDDPSASGAHSTTATIGWHPDLTLKQRTFLTAYAATRNATTAARVAGVDRVTPWRWRQEPLFRAAYDQASEVIGHTLQDEAFRRAMAGNADPQSATILLRLLQVYGPHPDYKSRLKVQHEGEVDIRHRIILSDREGRPLRPSM